MTEPLVSVVVPLFNKEKYIKATLQSVVNQTYRKIELVIVDDSSTDNSFKIAQHYLQNYPDRFQNIKLWSRTNTGQAGARNEGIGAAQGEFVAFLDADDVWHPEKVEKQVQYLQNNEVHDLVFCNYFMVFDGATRINAVRLWPIHKKVVDWLLTVGYGGLLESTGLARRASLLEMNGFESNLQMCGGLDLAYRLLQKNAIGCVDEYLCGYRVTNDGWHNNKADLIQSYELLLAKRNLYGAHEAKIRKYLQIYLRIWSFRNSTSRWSFFNLFIELFRSPVMFSSYILSTAIRVLMATLRGVVLRKNSFFIREALS